jgi:hypothetical protein
VDHFFGVTVDHFQSVANNFLHNRDRHRGVDGGWFSAAPYLTNERSHHMLQLLSAKDKVEHVLDDFLKHFR